MSWVSVVSHALGKVHGMRLNSTLIYYSLAVMKLQLVQSVVWHSVRELAYTIIYIEIS